MRQPIEQGLDAAREQAPGLAQPGDDTEREEGA